jgi:thiamine biosynthesis lipoprotein
VKKRKLRLKPLLPHAKRIARFLFKSQLLTVFLGLCVLGVWVGAHSRPSAGAIPYGELFDHMSVVSYRESPADSTSRFVVELAAGGKVFSQYDIDSRRFLPPAKGRAYSRSITGTHYRPLRVRGHVAQGFWIELPRAADRSLLPGQFDELYRTTLDFVKPVSVVTSVLGILSGYSVGYRLATWGGSLSSRSVQERVLATPDLGRTLAREAWRRVLIEPVVMVDEDNAARFAAVHGAHRLYANSFRLALNDSDGFLPREAARLAGLGHAASARTMLGFTSAVRRAAEDSVHLASADFAAVERWASLLERRGHWASGSIPDSGEARVSYLGTLAWYGLAPPAPDADRVWVGPRLLVRADDSEGFVADEITATRTGCPIHWRPRLKDDHTNAAAMAGAWFADRPEFPALITLGGRAAEGFAYAGGWIASNLRDLAAERGERRYAGRGGAARRTMPAAAGGTAGLTAAAVLPSSSAVTPAASAVPATESGGTAVDSAANGAAVADAGAAVAAAITADSAARRSVAYSFRSMGTYANVTLVTADSVASAPYARAAQAVFERVDSLMSNWTTTSEIARLNRESGSGAVPVQSEVAFVIDAALRAWRESERAFDITVEPLVRAWGFLGGPRRVPPQAELDEAFTRVGSQHLAFDAAARSLRFGRAGMKIDLGGIAKGHAVAAAAETLRALGVRDALVDISGNMAALGTPAHAAHWRIGIRDPYDRLPYLARIPVRGGQAISTSGKYEQFIAADGKTYGHIMDPRTGRPAEGLVSVTVMAPDAMAADAWSTALFVLGPAHARRIAKSRPDLAAVLIESGGDGTGTIWVESDLRERFELETAASARFRVEFF